MKNYFNDKHSGKIRKSLVHSVVPMHIAKTGHIVMSALLMVLGILLIIFRKIQIPHLHIICGSLLILFGVLRVVGYHSKDIYRLAFQFDLTFGFVLAALGLAFVIRPESVVYICVFFGLVVAADGIIKLRVAIQAKKFGIEAWWLIFVFAVMATVSGVVVAMRPTDNNTVLTALLGVLLLVEGIMGIITMVTSVKIVEYKDTGDR